MRLELSEDQEFFRETTRRFLESEAPLTTRARALGHRRTGSSATGGGRRPSSGGPALFVPEAHGGGSLSGHPAVDAVIVAEEMGRLVAPGPFLPVNVVCRGAGASAAATEQQAEVLPGPRSRARRSPRGRSPSAAARGTPPGCRSTAEPAGDGSSSRASKAYVEAAGVADSLLVTARTGDGLTQVLVPADADGVTVTPWAQHRPRPPLRIVSASTACVSLRRRSWARSAAPRAPSSVSSRSRSRCSAPRRSAPPTVSSSSPSSTRRTGIAFGRPIASFQALKHRIADMLVWLEFSKAISDGAAAGGRRRQRTTPRARQRGQGLRRRPKCLDLIDDCVQINGGIGVTWEHDIHLYSRRVAVNRAVYGSPEEHKERLCALLEV